MTETYNLNIPLTLLRLGVQDVEDLIVIGLSRDIDRRDIDDLLNDRYPNRRRAARALLRIVVDEDIDCFNDQVAELRRNGINESTRLSMRSSYQRGICTLRVFGA